MEQVLRAGAMGAFVLVGQVAAQPAPVEVRDLLEVTATVDAVDLATRTVTVSDGAGNEYVIEAGPEVRNLEQVEVGDEVVVSYYSALAGERPAAAVGETVTATIVIDSVDVAENTVTFTGPRGLRTVLVESPAGQEFIKQLKPGDEVELTYTEALAISVEPAN
jgi:translation elongation factor P/translation initiation factor 5A